MVTVIRNSTSSNERAPSPYYASDEAPLSMGAISLTGIDLTSEMNSPQPSIEE
jgi:hypothetical protein